MTAWLRRVTGRVIYALVLWVLVFSTLEQFAEVNRDFFRFSAALFHSLTAIVALAAAAFEAITLRGLSGLHNLWDRPDPLGDIANRKSVFRAAFTTDLPKVRKLALKRYGWAFTPSELKRWHQSNSKCLFLMVSEGDLIGYVDAFPISSRDYAFLLSGGREALITPLTEEGVTPDSVFYVASVVILSEWGGWLPALLKRAMTFYSAAYTRKVWNRVCAIGYSPQGRTLLETRQMQRVPGGNPAVEMYEIDRPALAQLRRMNNTLWQKLLPDVSAIPLATRDTSKQ